MQSFCLLNFFTCCNSVQIYRAGSFIIYTPTVPLCVYWLLSVNQYLKIKCTQNTDNGLCLSLLQSTQSLLHCQNEKRKKERKKSYLVIMTFFTHKTLGCCAFLTCLLFKPIRREGARKNKTMDFRFFNKEPPKLQCGYFLQACCSQMHRIKKKKKDASSCLPPFLHLLLLLPLSVLFYMPFTFFFKCCLMQLL